LNRAAAAPQQKTASFAFATKRFFIGRLERRKPYAAARRNFALALV
jgi:hypothetical protein